MAKLSTVKLLSPIELKYWNEQEKYVEEFFVSNTWVEARNYIIKQFYIKKLEEQTQRLKTSTREINRRIFKEKREMNQKEKISLHQIQYNINEIEHLLKVKFKFKPKPVFQRKYKDPYADM